MFRKITPVVAVVIFLITLVHLSPVGKASAQDVGVDAAIVGLAEFSPGSTSALQISVQNNNIIDKVDAPAIQGGVSQFYGSAAGLTAHLEKGNAPITVKTEKALLGTLHAGEATPPVPFMVEVNEDATPGTYQVKVLLTYRTMVLVSEKEEGEVGADLEWSSRSQTKELDIEIKAESLKFEVKGVTASLQPGARTEIEVQFENTDNEIAYDVEASLSANDPISLTDNNAFLGTLENGAAAVGTFGLKVAGDAIPKEYVLDAVIKYRDGNGDEYITKKMKVPVDVQQSSSIGELINQHYVGVIIGVVLMGIVWFISSLFFRSRRKSA